MKIGMCECFMNFYKIEHIYITETTLNPRNFSKYYWTSWISNHYQWLDISRFLRTRVITGKSNWKCKQCKVKILEPRQIQTSESHVPVYHIKCYMELRHACIEKINQHELYLQNQLNIMQTQLDNNSTVSDSST